VIVALDVPLPSCTARLPEALLSNSVVESLKRYVYGRHRWKTGAV
jgi:hypothetical protein